MSVRCAARFSASLHAPAWLRAGRWLYSRTASMPDLQSLLAYTALADREAFAQLYAATRSRAWAICLRLLRDTAAAEEAMQDAYVKIWSQAASYRPHLGSAEAWLAALVRNTCLDRLRASRREAQYVVAAPSSDDDDPEEIADHRTPEALLEAGLQGQAMEDCLGRLQPRQRDLLAAAYVMGQSHAEVARERAMPLGTVKTLIRRAVLLLRDCLGEGAR
ncbi:MAG: sigma-70 family RNA polymerase sigma factor [Thiomonas sp.]|jgi:RNA polymerase sigma-70 factor (ECF subfamily)